MMMEWNFSKVIDRAMLACKNSGFKIFDHFAENGKMVEVGVVNKKVKDFVLTRYACYLIVQNGDPREEVIALGQTYFAIQARRQEVAKENYYMSIREIVEALEITRVWSKRGLA